MPLRFGKVGQSKMDHLRKTDFHIVFSPAIHYFLKMRNESALSCLGVPIFDDVQKAIFATALCAWKLWIFCVKSAQQTLTVDLHGNAELFHPFTFNFISNPFNNTQLNRLLTGLQMLLGNRPAVESQTKATPRQLEKCKCCQGFA